MQADFSVRPEFLDSLCRFVDAFVAGERAERLAVERERALLSSIAWRDREIARLEAIPDRRDRSRQISELRHQRRECELRLAFGAVS